MNVADCSSLSTVLPLPFGGPPVLACGGDVKNAFCLTSGNRAHISVVTGDLKDYRAYRTFAGAVADMRSWLDVDPRVVVHDMHPDYVSTRYALAAGCPVAVAVQHHHAHVAACAAENGLREAVIGVALDGTGYGTDGTVWGGEVLVADYSDFRRVAHFRPYTMPGAEAAVRNPARMALSCLKADVDDWHGAAATLLPELDVRHVDLIGTIMDHKVNSPLTSSAGRLFDAVSALLGLCRGETREGAAAVALQSAASPGVPDRYGHEIHRERDCLVLSFRPMIRGIVRDLGAGRDRGWIAAAFHNTLAAALAEACDQTRSKESLNKVVLSGGVFQNSVLLDGLSRRLREAGFEVFTHRVLSPSDTGIALGQAAIALSRSGTAVGGTAAGGC